MLRDRAPGNSLDILYDTTPAGIASRNTAGTVWIPLKAVCHGLVRLGSFPLGTPMPQLALGFLRMSFALVLEEVCLLA
jgi:hypothetical protein